MNITQDLHSAIRANPVINPDHARNVLKEVLQDYALKYIYSSTYQFLIFTGGTCLKKCFGLNRLSEDLDFDYEQTQQLDIEAFSQDITEFFVSLGLPKVTPKIAGNATTVMLKIDLAGSELISSLGLTSSVLYLRCDMSQITYTGYATEVSLVQTPNYSFFAKHFTLSTLFANKLVAFLQRDFYKGAHQSLPLKGRDVYDLYWLTSLSAKSSFSLTPAKPVLFSRLESQSVEEIRETVKTKLALIDPEDVHRDLLPLISPTSYLDSFVQSYPTYLLSYLPALIQ